MSTTCDQVFENYAAAINNFSPVTDDLEPGILLFDSVQCSGTPFPKPLFQSNTYQSGDEIKVANWGFAVVRTFYIPWTFRKVSVESKNGRTSTFVGPWEITDTANVNWQYESDGTTLGKVSMSADPIATITFDSILEWESQALLPMCMGGLRFISAYPLVRYTGQTDRCDEFMTNEWCVDQRLNRNTECECLSELPEIEKKSQELGVALPVICFGEGCATDNTYKTLAMLDQPCNLTICEQTVREAPGVIDQSTNTVFCGGQFFRQDGSSTNPNVSPVTSPAATTGDDAPFYVWIMLGISGIIFVVLIFLLFYKKPIRSPSILRQIKKLTSQNNVDRAQRPDLNTSYNDPDPNYAPALQQDVANNSL